RHLTPRAGETRPNGLGVRVAEPPRWRECHVHSMRLYLSRPNAECRMLNAETAMTFCILHSAFDVMKKWAPLLVLSLALAIIIIDTTLLNVSLTALVRELHTTLQALQWVISAYSL